MLQQRLVALCSRTTGSVSLGTHTLTLVYVRTNDRSAIAFTEQGFRLHNVRRLGQQKAVFSPRPSGSDGPVGVRAQGRSEGPDVWVGPPLPPSPWLEPVERSIGRLCRRSVENPRVTRIVHIERPDPAAGSSLTGPCARPRPPGGWPRRGLYARTRTRLSFRRRYSTR